MLWPWLIFVAVIGACVGSFLNVVIYRLPAGQSIIGFGRSSQRSHCPKCGHNLAWYDNVPVLGWLWLRGRCRYCRAAISPQYPIIEAITGVLFSAWFYVAYMTDLRPEFAWPGPADTAIIFAVTLALIGSLVAATVIDARLYIIPLEIPWFVTVVAVLLLPLAVALSPGAVVNVEVAPMARDGLILSEAERLPPEIPGVLGEVAEVRIAAHGFDAAVVPVTAAPLVSSKATAAGLGGIAGLIIAIVLMKRRILPRSFEEDVVPVPGTPGVAGEAKPQAAGPENAHGTPEEWLAHPHPRREILKECGFVAFPIAGAAVGTLFITDAAVLPAALNVLGGVLIGYLGGGAVVWATRIFGTLGFGKEAMGLGDVHLMAAVGAVCGWEVAVLAFFVAPFFGLGWAIASIGAARMLKREVRAIPYGPHLAAATLVVMAVRHPLVAYFGVSLAGG